MLNLLKKACAIQGVSGHEGKISEFFKSVIAKYTDECYNDNLGNLIAVKYANQQTNNKKKVLLCAHMDEIGFMTTFIEDNGYIRCASFGGISHIASAYSVVEFENGTKGVLVPEREIKLELLTLDKFYVDIGAKNKKEAERKVKIGECFAVKSEITKLCGSKIAGRPLDDRIGCVIMIEIAKQLYQNQTKLTDDLYFVFSVQEEVGCRGSKTAAYAIGADYAVVFDVTGTGDSIGSIPMACKVSEGTAIKVKDASVICHHEVVDLLTSLAKAKGIKYQHEILQRGGTDTSSIQMTGSGCRVGALSIPTRYIHSACEMCDMNDAHATVDLTIEFLKADKA